MIMNDNKFYMGLFSIAILLSALGTYKVTYSHIQVQEKEERDKFIPFLTYQTEFELSNWSGDESLQCHVTLLQTQNEVYVGKASCKGTYVKITAPFTVYGAPDEYIWNFEESILFQELEENERVNNNKRQNKFCIGHPENP